MSAGQEKNGKWYDHSTDKNTSGSSGEGWQTHPYSWQKEAAAAAAKTTPETSSALALHQPWLNVNSAAVVELAG